MAITKGLSPPFGDDLDLHCKSFPREIFAAFEGAVRHMPPAGDDEALGFAYLFLLKRLLEHLRYRTDRGYSDAAALIEEFQSAVGARAKAEEIDGRMLAYVTGALQQSNIPVSPELTAASATQHVNDNAGVAIPAAVSVALNGLLDLCGGDSFMLINALAELSHAMPIAARGALAASFALGKRADARAAAVLFLLDSDADVRRMATGALGKIAASLSPTDLRRLVAIRNWRPENERTAVDAVIRGARAAGIDCAQSASGSVETIRATAIDGAGTQGFLLVSPAGRKKRMSSILTKYGIADGWSGEPETRRGIEAAMSGAGMDMPMLAVSRSYLDRMVAHHLALSTEQGEVPPLGLLQVAETIGGVDWQPARIDFQASLHVLMGAIPETMREPTAITMVLRRSAELSDLEMVAPGWFEDDPEIAQTIAEARTRNRAKLATYLLQSVIARRREKWAELVLRTALWMREACEEHDLCWRELAIVATALAEGRDLTEIGLMREVARHTIEAHLASG
jgi:hypothetical protein